MSVKKRISDDRLYCKSIAKSISDIIRFSLDDEFRKKCFELFEVSSTNETEREIKKRLMALTQCKKTGFQKSKPTTQGVSENLFENGDEEKESTSTTYTKDDGEELRDAALTPSTTTDSNSQCTPQNIFKRNWLQISSQQYRDIIKRKKLNYHSQPQLDQGNQNDLEFYSYRTNDTDSQPSSSSSSLFSQGRISSSQPLSDTTNFFKEKFRDSFKDNTHKYFRNNLKSHKVKTETSQLTRKFSF